MVRISQLKIKAEKGLDTAVRHALLRRRLAKKLRLSETAFFAFTISGEAIDARRKPEVYWVYSVDAQIAEGDEKLLTLAKKAGLQAAPLQLAESIWTVADPVRDSITDNEQNCRPVVVGFGPCGIFAALTLAHRGLRPIVLERGSAMDERVAAVERFWYEGVLDPACNVQFGEGGAGTFSDGKLTTGTKDPANRWVLEAFVRAGADPDILFRQRPHVGTDVLRRVVVALRKEITALGGEVCFGTKLERLDIRGGRLRGLYLTPAGGCSRKPEEYLPADIVVLALGHSARDTVSHLFAQGLAMEQKPFSMGVRIEHKQKDIDLAQYGIPAEELCLPPADYKLAAHTAAGRGVYTFCMCPGGYVVASASEEGGLVTNGMSNRDRAGENANSALLCDVRPEDFGSAHPLAGMELQRKYEKLAFELGGGNYCAPAQRVGDFLGCNAAEANRQNVMIPKALSKDALLNGIISNDSQNDIAAVTAPSYRPGTTWTEIERCLPGFVTEALREVLPMMDKKLKGFADPTAVLTAIESRSSSPVRIKRAASGEALAADGTVIQGLYPGGEGAGYAGGIMSAAADGIRIAQRIADTMRSEER